MISRGKKTNAPATPVRSGSSTPQRHWKDTKIIAVDDLSSDIRFGFPEIVDPEAIDATFVSNLRADGVRETSSIVMQAGVRVKQPTASGRSSSASRPRGSSPGTPRSSNVFSRLTDPSASRSRRAGRSDKASPSPSGVKSPRQSKSPERRAHGQQDSMPSPISGNSVGVEIDMSQLKSDGANQGASVDDVTIQDVFHRFTGGNSFMDGRAFVKVCKDSHLLDKRFLSTDADLVFSRAVPKGQRRLGIVDFYHALELVAQKKKSTLGTVHEAVVSSGGPVHHGQVTPREKVRLHDDKTTYTGIHSHCPPESPRKAWREANRTAALTGKVLRKQENEYEQLANKLNKVRESVATLEQELADSYAQVQRARTDHEQAQDNLRNAEYATASSAPVVDEVQLNENIIVYTPELPEDDPDCKEIHEAYFKLRTMAEEFRVKCEQQKAKIAAPKAKVVQSDIEAELESARAYCGIPSKVPTGTPQVETEGSFSSQEVDHTGQPLNVLVTDMRRGLAVTEAAAVAAELEAARAFCGIPKSPRSASLAVEREPAFASDGTDPAMYGAHTVR